MRDCFPPSSCFFFGGDHARSIQFATLLLYSWVISLPAASLMFVLALGVQRMNEILPDPVYALLSGLNASTVGIVALAAVQLAEKAITDSATRILVIFSACAGLCYSAIWYFPALMVVSGAFTVVWDHWLRQSVARFQESVQRRRRVSHILAEGNTPGSPADVALDSSHDTEGVEKSVTRRAFPSHSISSRPTDMSSPVRGSQQSSNGENERQAPQNQSHGANTLTHVIPLKVGITIILTFFGM